MSNRRKKYLIVIVGPTAVGKTDLSIRIAQALNTEIISADSRQFFRELNIGTAKPSQEDLSLVRHHFIDSHSISEAYSAGDFERDVLAFLNEFFLESDYIVMTGGSGLYVKAVLDGLDDLPQPLPELRRLLTSRLEAEGLEVLQNEIGKLDPAFAAGTEFANPQRVLRALEVFHTSGVPISDYQKQKSVNRNFDTVLVALERDRNELYDRINQRMDIMLDEGLVEEAKGIINFRTHHALQTVGYKEIYGFLDGLYDEKEMVRLLKQNSRRYAKRQMTWFRHQGNFKWFGADDFQEVLKYIKSGLTQ